MLNKKEAALLLEISNALKALVEGTVVQPELGFLATIRKKMADQPPGKFHQLKEKSRKFYEQVKAQYGSGEVEVGGEKLRKILFDCHISTVAPTVKGLEGKGLAQVRYLTTGAGSQVMQSFHLLKLNEA